MNQEQIDTLARARRLNAVSFVLCIVQAVIATALLGWRGLVVFLVTLGLGSILSITWMIVAGVNITIRQEIEGRERQ